LLIPDLYWVHNALLVCFNQYNESCRIHNFIFYATFLHLVVNELPLFNTSRPLMNSYHWCFRKAEEGCHPLTFTGIFPTSCRDWRKVSDDTPVLNRKNYNSLKGEKNTLPRYHRLSSRYSLS